MLLNFVIYIIMQYVTGAIFVKTVGIDVALQCCVSTLVSSIQGICSILKHLKSNESYACDIKLILDELDIEATLQVLHVFILELNIDDIQTNTFSQALDNLKNVIIEIEENFKQIKYRYDYNNSLWISYYRLYTFDDIICKLKTLRIKLDKRYSLLFETLKIRNCLKFNNNHNICNNL